MKNSERIALVTGAGTGIGRAASLALAKSGWQVVLAGRREAPLNETVEQMDDQDKALAVPTDVANPASVGHLFQTIETRLGRLDFLFNNAGIAAPNAPLDSVTDQQWNEVVDINLNGMFYCLKNAFQLMKRQNPQGGRIVNNGSLAATTPRPRSIAYAATKHAVTGLTKATSLEGREFSIACGQIDIGNAATEMAMPVTKGALQPNGEHSAEPVMDVERVADSVVHMAELPLDANILFLTVMATNMPFVGRG